MKNKSMFVMSSIATLLPMIAGIILWNELPDEVATHFDVYGNPDGYSDKDFAVFVIPFIILVLHIFCVLGTSLDPKNENVSPKMQNFIYWICPLVSVVMGIVVYCYGMGLGFSVLSVLYGFIGIIFVIIGNYLPKCKQNYTVGIKIPWTLNDTENWNKTHRLAGKVLVIAGLVWILGVFVEINAIIMSLGISVVVFIPIIYSYCLYSKKNKN